MRRDDIHNLLISKGYTGGSHEYLANYRKAESEYMASIPADEIQNLYQGTADKWNKAGAPPDVQRRSVVYS